MRDLKKITIALSILFTFYYEGTCQSWKKKAQGNWLPKSYVEYLTTHKNEMFNYSDAELKFFRPVEALVIDKDKVYVRTLFGELNEVPYKSVNNSIELPSLQINLGYPEMSIFKGTKVRILFKESKDLQLHVSYANKHETILFTNRIASTAPIISPMLIKHQILLNKKFHVYLAKSDKLYEKIMVDGFGKVTNSRRFSKIIMKNLSEIYTGKETSYVKSLLIFHSGESMKVILMFNANKSIAIYKDNNGHLGKILFRFLQNS